MFDRYPKTRPELPEEFAAIYHAQYKENRKGGSRASALSQKMEGWLHRKVAADVVGGGGGKSTLEIGAGTLNQLPYEPQSAAYDIVEPFEALYEDATLAGRVRTFYGDVRDVPREHRYDRITAVAAFEHICNLPEVVARSSLLLKENGVLRVAGPSEGTLLWTLGWKTTTGLEFRIRYGLDYGVLMRHEHVNTAREIEEVLRYFFGRIATQVFGLTRRFSLYQFHECTEPDKERSMSYLEQVMT